MAELDEEQGWIRKSQHGDYAAFEVFARRNQRMIHSLTFRMIDASLKSVMEEPQQRTVRRY
jgi:hypothetical protein